jgi:hypothetical protein
MFSCFYNSIKPIEIDTRKTVKSVSFNNHIIAADFIHSEWMKRNPKQDYNAHQHIPFNILPESEKQKDRDQINIIKNLINDNNISQNMTYHDYFELIADKFGALAHENWRNDYELKFGIGKPRMKDISTGGIFNINCPWPELHPEWKKENLEAGRAAMYAYFKYLY